MSKTLTQFCQSDTPILWAETWAGVIASGPLSSHLCCETSALLVICGEGDQGPVFLSFCTWGAVTVLWMGLSGGRESSVSWPYSAGVYSLQLVTRKDWGILVACPSGDIPYPLTGCWGDRSPIFLDLTHLEWSICLSCEVRVGGKEGGSWPKYCKFSLFKI